MNEELAKIAEDIRNMEMECWRGRKMGPGAVALMLNGYADRIEIAIGLQPRPKIHYTPQTAIDAVTTNPPMKSGPLYAENLRKAGIRSGCFAYLFAALIVCALLAAIPLLMVFLGWLTGGAK